MADDESRLTWPQLLVAWAVILAVAFGVGPDLGWWSRHDAVLFIVGSVVATLTRRWLGD